MLEDGDPAPLLARDELGLGDDEGDTEGDDSAAGTAVGPTVMRRTFAKIF